MADEEEKIALVFHGSWTKYFQGDIAGFEPFLAKKLLGMQMVDSKGNRSPLVSKYKKPFLERAGITKSDTAAPDPIGGTEEKKVVGPDSEELVSGPAHRGRGKRRKP